MVEKDKAEGDLSPFEKFAEAASEFASRAPFFVFCVALIVIWMPTIVLLDFNTSQLIINTVTTIITFLMVALLQNSQKRAENATNYKQNVIADALADFMDTVADQYDSEKLRNDARELREAAGIEEQMSA